MSKVVKLDFIWDEEVAKKSFDELYKYEFNHSAKKYIGWIFIALLQFGVVGAFKKGDASLLIFSTVVLAYWYIFKKMIAKRLFLKRFENDPLKDKEIILKADEKGLHFKNQNIFWKWDEIESLEDVKNGLLLIKYPNHYFIPLNAFKSFEDKNDFKMLYKESKKHQIQNHNQTQ